MDTIARCAIWLFWAVVAIIVIKMAVTHPEWGSAIGSGLQGGVEFVQNIITSAVSLLSPTSIR